MDIGILKQKFVDMIDAVVYINLDHRTDRNDHMLEIVKIFGQKVQRFEAIKGKLGFIGCSESHAAVMQMAIESNWKNILILEDDVLWNENIDAYRDAIELLTNPYDVIMLGSYNIRCDLDTRRFKSGTATHAYVINRHYFETLYSNICEGLRLLKASSPKYLHAYRIDRYKDRLSAKDKWYVVMPNLFYQRNDYSDTNNRARVDLENIAVTSLPNKIERKSVSKVSWGVVNRRMIDVTSEFQSIPSGKVRLTYELFKIDPARGSKKTLVIEYLDGRESTYIEYSTITIVNR